jgi:23S rRNA pseudouridine1911/1915/1917 synthase
MTREKRARPLGILYLDADLVVVDKPSGVGLTAGDATRGSVAELLRAQGVLADERELRGVQRVEPDASGVLVCARTLEAQRHVATQFVAQRVESLYHAIVSGYVVADGECNLAVVFDRRRQRVRATPIGGKPALTRYRIVQRLAGHTLLECEPVTGRIHQLRVHLEAIGHPLAVDPLYGGGQALWLSHHKAGYRASRRREEQPLIQRLTLHVRQVTLEHPRSGQKLTLVAEWPKDFRATVVQLGRLASASEK